MTSHVPRPRGRAVIPLLVVLLGVALGAGATALLRPFGALSTAPASSLTGQSAVRSLSPQAVYNRLEPSIVDVTSTLRYDDETAAGTGFVVNGPAGLVLTNNHVVRDATSVTATVTSTGKSYPASIVGVDVGADIAVLRLQGAPRLPAAPIGDSAAITLGTPVLAIGNQAGRNGPPTIAPGIINSLNRTIQANDGASGFTETLHDMLQTSAQIEPGDSGGPLANAAGAVVGVDTAAGPGNSGIGYAIPIDGAMAVARQIAAGRPAPGITLGVAGFLGVIAPSTTITIPRLQARGEHNPRPGAGTRRQAPLPPSCLDSEAAAGITAGDVIIAVAGHTVSSPNALTAVVSASHPGTTVTVTWVATSGAIRTSMILIGPAPAVLLADWHKTA